MTQLPEERIREIVREEMKAAIEAAAIRIEENIIETIEKKLVCDTVQGLYK
jgi:hypothetical protein